MESRILHYIDQWDYAYSGEKQQISFFNIWNLDMQNNNLGIKRRRELSLGPRRDRMGQYGLQRSWRYRPQCRKRKGQRALSLILWLITVEFMHEYMYASSLHFHCCLIVHSTVILKHMTRYSRNLSFVAHLVLTFILEFVFLIKYLYFP